MADNLLERLIELYGRKADPALRAEILDQTSQASRLAQAVQTLVATPVDLHRIPGMEEVARLEDVLAGTLSPAAQDSLHAEELIIMEGGSSLGFDDYWLMDEQELASEFAEFGEEQLAYRGSGEALEPYLDKLQEFVCSIWNWKSRRNLPEFTNAEFTARSLTEAMEQARLALPFPYSLVAISLVKADLNRLCN